jgi:hypothetical protein
MGPAGPVRPHIPSGRRVGPMARVDTTQIWRSARRPESLRGGPCRWCGWDSVPSLRCFLSSLPRARDAQVGGGNRLPRARMAAVRRLQVKAYPPANSSSPGPHVSLTRRHAFSPTRIHPCLLAALRCLRLLGYIAASRGWERPNQQPFAHRNIAARDRLLLLAGAGVRVVVRYAQLSSHLVVSLYHTCAYFG